MRRLQTFSRARAWSAPNDGRLAPDSPLSNFWASDRRGIDQVRSVYPAQGFEFDSVGVISGRDLHWDPAANDWIRDPSHSQDSIVKPSGNRFTGIVKRTYRVRLTGGLKCCFVTCLESPTRGHLYEIVGH